MVVHPAYPRESGQGGRAGGSHAQFYPAIKCDRSTDSFSLLAEPNASSRESTHENGEHCGAGVYCVSKKQPQRLGPGDFVNETSGTREEKTHQERGHCWRYG